MSPPPASRTLVALLLAGCALTWGSAFIIMKLMRGEVDPLTMSSVRAVVAAAALGLFVALRGQSPLPGRAEWRDWLVLGTVNGWVPNILVAYGLVHMAAGPAAMIQSATPLVTAVIAHLVFAEERLTPRRIGGIGLGMLGTALLIGPDLAGGRAEPTAVLAMFGVVLGYSTGNLYARLRRAADPARLALGQQVVSGAVATALALAFAAPGRFAAALQDHGWMLLALGVASTAVPITLYMHLIQRAGPTRAAMTGYAVPVAAVVLAFLVLGERLGPHQIAGGAITLVGVAIATSGRTGPRLEGRVAS